MSPFVDQLLHPMQHRLALLVVELNRLLLVERIDVGVAAIDKRAALDDISLVSGRGVAKSAGNGLDDVFECLLGVSLDEGGALDRPQLHPDANCLEVIEHSLADIGVGRVAKIAAAVEALRKTRLGEDLSGLLRVIDRGRRLPEELVIVRYDRIPGDERITEGQRQVEAVAVDRQAGGPPHPLVMPRRLLVPLIREVYVEYALNDRRLEGQAWCALQLFG